MLPGAWSLWMTSFMVIFPVLQALYLRIVAVLLKETDDIRSPLQIFCDRAEVVLL